MKLSCKGPVSFLVKSLQLHPMVTSTLQAWAPLLNRWKYANMDERWHHLMEFPFTADIMAIDSSFVSWSPCRIWMYLVHHPHRHFFLITHVIRVWSIRHQPPGSISASFASKMTHRLGPFNGGHPVARKPGTPPHIFCGIKILVTEARKPYETHTVKSVFFSDRAWAVSAGRWRHVSFLGGLSMLFSLLLRMMILIESMKPHVNNCIFYVPAYFRECLRCVA